MKATSTKDCEDWSDWLCECCDTTKCASYKPPEVKPEVEVKQDKQLTLFEL